MTAWVGYIAATSHLAAAIVRHVADGLDLIGETVNPTITVTLTQGTTRVEWCDACRLPHAAVTMYAHDGDPTAAHPVGTWVDCDLINEPEDDE